jgi:hypothetical protein
MVDEDLYRDIGPDDGEAIERILDRYRAKATA